MAARERGGSQSETIMAEQQARAVRFDRYGGREVLYVADIPMPVPAAGEVVVAVRAASINLGEAAIRMGALHDRFPATFPSGEGSDLAGVVSAVGPAVDAFAVGDAVLGYSWRRSSHATHTSVPVTQLIRKPPSLSWEVAGSLYVAGSTAYAAVQAVQATAGDAVAVSAAAGGVGSIAVQLLALRGAHVLAIASRRHAAWLESHGATPVPYGDGLAERLKAAAPGGIDAFIDCFGPEYVQLAIDLGIAPQRINTIIAFAMAQEVGARTEGSMAGTSREVLSELADLAASGALEIPIAATFPLDRVADAFELLEQRHTQGKIVLIP
jgi:NADPH:quinone reductase-like Zn-dependent oxidoreductase